MYHYNNMWKIILASFLIVNSLFWGLYPHSEHCNMGYFIGLKSCPSYLIHIAIGVLFYLTAMFIMHFNSVSITFGQ